MSFPDFFEAAPRITVRDPLARFLGAAEGGVFEYHYADVVKLAGHSCPTVASAYLMTRAGLRALYGDDLPERGNVRVELRDPPQEGVTGVIANVAGFLTGATQETGFKGIGGKFDRRNLLFFEAGIEDQMRFTCLDTGASASVSARLDRVPGDPRMGPLIQRAIRGEASPADEKLFQSLWQARVRALLLEHADDPETIVVR